MGVRRLVLPEMLAMFKYLNWQLPYEDSIQDQQKRKWKYNKIYKLCLPSILQRYINAKRHVKINCQTKVSTQIVILHKATVDN
jgi:hypothetical protein